MQYVLNDFEYHNLIDSINAQYTKGRYEGMNITKIRQERCHPLGWLYELP